MELTMQTVTQSYAMHVYSQAQTAQGSQAGMRGASPATPSGPAPSVPPGEGPVSDQTTISSQGREISQKNIQAAGNREKGVDQQPLSEEELAKLTELQKRDTEVRAHEQAHLAAAGQYAAGGASFSYTTGPNGKRYATGGEVPIDISKEDTPAATIVKMQTVRRAALAPATPSSTDRAIAAQASAKEAAARKELQAEGGEPATTTQKPKHSTPTTEQQGNSTPDISDYSRRRMTSAYQAIAALAS